MTPNKFDEILKLEEALKNDSFGEVKQASKNAFPYIVYSETVCKLIDAVYSFHKANPDYDLFNYMAILACNGYTDINVNTVDVSGMDDKCLMALFMALIRGERFHDGLILDALKSGSVQRWLERLRAIASEI